MVGCESGSDVNIQKIKMGDDKSTVISILGEPDEITKCDRNLWWGAEYLGEDVKSLCRYSFWYGTVKFDRWRIGFDEKNKVISKYHYVSE